jgi:hypothetical protein
MNPSTLTRIQTFIEDILQPAFIDLEDLLEIPGQKVIIANKPDTGIDAVDTLLRKMHSGKSYFETTLNSSSAQEFPATTQAWISDSLSVEILENPETAPTHLGQYCLSIEISITSSEQIQLASIIGYSTPGSETAQVGKHLFEDTLEIEEIDSSEIILLCSKSFESFKNQILTPEKILEEAPETIPFLTGSPSLIPSDPEQSTSSEPSPEAQPEPTPFIDPQTLYDLSKQLTQALAPPGFPIHSKFNPKLPIPAQIKPIQDRYQRTIDLGLEYSPAITEAELTEYLHRLGHYQTLKHLTHLHIFIQEQMQAWHKQNGQPSLGAIAPHLQHHIIELRDYLYQRIQTLIDRQLDSTAQTLQTEVDTLTAKQQQQQTLLDELEQNPLLGYLDTHLLDPTNQLKELIQPFTAPNQPIDIPAQHVTTKADKLILSHIAPCDSEKYKAYRQRKSERPELKRIIEYTITQKLYPQRPVFIGAAPKPVSPRLELLWGSDDTPTNASPLNQIWCIYPMMRTDPPQWLIIAATTDTQPLRTITLENGQIAQEGTHEYLCHALHLMTECKDEYTQALSKHVTEAIEYRRIKYLHIHQTHDLQTAEPRDILQMQFRLVPSVSR